MEPERPAFWAFLPNFLPEARFALEDPGYYMVSRTLQSRGIPFDAVATDSEGLCVDQLRKSRAAICLVTPSNQFPLGVTMRVNRRTQLLNWAGEEEGRYLVEDDYDSDYRYALKPPPALHTLDTSGRVIYCNTFVRTLSPSLRIAYMVLPPSLIARYLLRRRYYACTVSAFEQRTLWRFIKGGSY